MSMKFGTVVVDPPWEYKGGFPAYKSQGPRTVLPYRSMDLDAIKALDVRSLVRKEGYVFLWATNKHLPAAFAVLNAWSLTYRQTVTWCKPRTKGLGGMFGTNVEFVLVAQNIRPGTNAHGSRTKRERADSSWFEWKRRAHSEKPDEFYALLQELSEGPYLDVFARQSREGWTCIGDGIDGMEIEAAMSGLLLPSGGLFAEPNP